MKWRCVAYLVLQMTLCAAAAALGYLVYTQSLVAVLSVRQLLHPVDAGHVAAFDATIDLMTQSRDVLMGLLLLLWGLASSVAHGWWRQQSKNEVQEKQLLEEVQSQAQSMAVEFDRAVRDTLAQATALTTSVVHQAQEMERLARLVHKRVQVFSTPAAVTQNCESRLGSHSQVSLESPIPLSQECDMSTGAQVPKTLLHRSAMVVQIMSAVTGVAHRIRKDIHLQIAEIKRASMLSAHAVGSILEDVEHVFGGTTSVLAAVQQQSSAVRDLAENLSRSSQHMETLSRGIERMRGDVTHGEELMQRVLSRSEELQNNTALFMQTAQELLGRIEVVAAETPNHLAATQQILMVQGAMLADGSEKVLPSPLRVDTESGKKQYALLQGQTCLP